MAKEHSIDKVLPGSIAEELEIAPGDVLISINGQRIEDVFDYHYLVNDEFLTVIVRKADGEEWELEIEKDYTEDLGIEFCNGLMDDYKSCQNKCMFCFIDQMPKGMRDTLYFKDDDSRLSFLQGNYVTLTNMKEKDIERIIHYHLEPINVSVHTMNPELRCKMLNNRFAGEALQKMARLKEAGVEMNGQIVLCKGVNDGEELDYSIEKLTEYLPYMRSLSVVPVGLTKYREGLYPLEPFEKEDAIEVLNIIHKWQKYCMDKYDTHFVHASDEWYLLADEKIPEEESYDGYLQLENGVGMMRLLENEFMESLASVSAENYAKKEKTITLVTGRLAAPLLEALATRFMEKFSWINVQVIAIRNDFFGERITVSGLLTGQDILAQLKEKNLGEKLLLPCNLLRSGEEVLLDDLTLADLKNALQVKIDIVKSSGQDLLNELLSD
ncbi:MAG: DUF512 domain-containing protein [Lachnospiraceae bacterium]|nr:DUF512 domain-containing protein [Lachnospiraceae bacterium]